MQCPTVNCWRRLHVQGGTRDIGKNYRATPTKIYHSPYLYHTCHLLSVKKSHFKIVGLIFSHFWSLANNDYNRKQRIGNFVGWKARIQKFGRLFYFFFQSRHFAYILEGPLDPPLFRYYLLCRVTRHSALGGRPEEQGFRHIPKCAEMRVEPLTFGLRD